VNEASIVVIQDRPEGDNQAVFVATDRQGSTYRGLATLVKSHNPDLVSIASPLGLVVAASRDEQLGRDMIELAAAVAIWLTVVGLLYGALLFLWERRPELMFLRMIGQSRRRIMSMAVVLVAVPIFSGLTIAVVAGVAFGSVFNAANGRPTVLALVDLLGFAGPLLLGMLLSCAMIERASKRWEGSGVVRVE